MEAPPPPPPVTSTTNSTSLSRMKTVPKKQSSIVERAQNSLQWRVGKGSLPTYSIKIGENQVTVKQHPQTAESEMATGSTVWDCAIVMANYLQSYCSKLPENYWVDKNVLEVGSGTGIVGIICGLLFQGSNLIISDLEILLPLIRENLETNQNALGDNLTKNISVQNFTWGTAPELNPSPPYDYIIASDVVWPKIDNSLLIDALKRVTNENTKIILAYEYRNQSCRTTFFKAAEPFFEFTRLPESELGLFTTDDIEVYHIKRKNF